MNYSLAHNNVPKIHLRRVNVSETFMLDLNTHPNEVFIRGPICYLQVGVGEQPVIRVISLLDGKYCEMPPDKMVIPVKPTSPITFQIDVE